MTTLVGNCGQLWAGTLSPQFAKPPFRLSQFEFCSEFCEDISCFVSWGNGDESKFTTNPRHFSCARGPPQFSKRTLREWKGQMKILHVSSHQFRESLRELLRESWFLYCPSRGMPFREWNFVFREWNFEFRELLREYPGTLPELREWPSHSESVFPEIGVVPSLPIFSMPNLQANTKKNPRKFSGEQAKQQASNSDSNHCDCGCEFYMMTLPQKGGRQKGIVKSPQRGPAARGPAS